MPTLTAALLTVAAAGTALYGLLFGSSKSDGERGNSSVSPPSSTSTTSPPYPSSPPDSYPRGQTNSRTSTTSNYYHHDFFHSGSSRSPTHGGDTYRASSTSTHPQPSYLQQPSSTRTAQAAEKAKASRATWDYDRFTYRPDSASPYTGESRETPGTPVRTPASHSTQLPSTRIGQAKGSSTTTAGYGTSAHRTGLASHHVGESGQIPSTSTRTQTSYPQLPTHTRVAEATAKTQASPAPPDYDGYGHRSSLATVNPWESHETSVTVARVRASLLPAQLASTRVSQSTASTTTTADYVNGVRRSHLVSPYSAESPLTGPASSTRASNQRTLFPDDRTATAGDNTYGVRRSRLASPYSQETPLTSPASPTRASYQRTPSPDDTPVHASGYLQSPPTHSRTLSSSSGSDYRGTTSSTRVVPRSPSPVPDGLYGVEFETTANAEDMKTARQLRERARRSNRAMREARDMAKNARKIGDYETAQTYKQDAIAHESEMKNLDKRAAKIIFRENNKVRGQSSRGADVVLNFLPSCQALKEGTVDLHGLYVVEAIDYAKKELQSAIYRNDDMVYFIVGTSFSGPLVCMLSLTSYVWYRFHLQARDCTPTAVCRSFGLVWRNSVMST